MQSFQSKQGLSQIWIPCFQVHFTFLWWCYQGIFGHMVFPFHFSLPQPQWHAIPFKQSHFVLRFLSLFLFVFLIRYCSFYFILYCVHPVSTHGILLRFVSFSCVPNRSGDQAGGGIHSNFWIIRELPPFFTIRYTKKQISGGWCFFATACTVSTFRSNAHSTFLNLC